MKIHLKTKQGMFTVVDYGRDYITLQTKLKHFTVPAHEFKCFAGGGWGEATEHDQKLFLSVVAPHMLEKTLETEAKIKALASLIDIQEKAKQTASEYISAIAAQQGEEYENTVLDTSDLESDDDGYDDWLREVKEEEERRTPKEWNGMLSRRDEQLQDLKSKLNSIASKVYANTPDLSKYQNTKGTKFIIQVAHDDVTDCRMCFDPYCFVDNFHSSISGIYRSNKYFTANGGWLKVINDDVILYYKSGDYGVYNDATAIECAKKLFPGKNIYSYAGKQWDDALDVQFPTLPF